jgi:hypothetical protein
MNISEAKILAVPGYLVEIPGSDFPARLMIFIFIYCTQAGSSGAGLVEKRMLYAVYGHSGIITTN